MDTVQRESSYKRTLELGYIFALIFIILLAYFSKRYENTAPLPKRIVISENFLVEDIPITKQGIPRKRPPRPQAIIPVTEEVVPEDEIIEDLDILSVNSSEGRSGFSSGEGFSVEILPRPLAEVFPEFPKEAIEAGSDGVVLLHLLINETGSVSEIVVLENTTGSVLCAVAAKNAARRNKFIPAQKSGKNVAMWIEKSYVFKAPK